MIEEEKWEEVNTESRSYVRRLKVPGGWLYQIQTGSKWDNFQTGTTKPVYGETTYVPEVS